MQAIDYRLPVASAQVKTAILFATLFARGTTTVEEPVRTRDHGELALHAFGAELTRNGNRVTMTGGQKLHAIEAAVPGDISSAAFFLCAAALFPGSNLLLDSVLMNPTRAALLDVLLGMGCRISVVNLEEHHGELVGSVAVEGAELKGATIAGALSAALIDELPVLAAIAPYTTGRHRDSRRARAAGEGVGPHRRRRRQPARHGRDCRGARGWIAGSRQPAASRSGGRFRRRPSHRHGLRRGRPARQRATR